MDTWGDVRDSQVDDLWNLINRPHEVGPEAPDDFQFDLITDGDVDFNLDMSDPWLIFPTESPPRPLDDAYRLPDKQADRLLEHLPIDYRSEKLTAQDVSEVNRNSPKLQDHIQTPEYLEIVDDGTLYSTYEREVKAGDWTQPILPPDHPVHLEVEFPSSLNEIAFSAEANQAEISSCQVGGIDTSINPAALDRHDPLVSHPYKVNADSAPSEVPPPQKPCAVCVFAKKTSKQCVDSPCRRCMRLVRNENMRAGGIRYRNLGEQTPNLKELIFFDIKEVQILLSALRLDIDHISFQGRDRSQNSLEKCFKRTGHILCHLDQGKTYNPYSTTSVTVCINRLATTTNAKMISGELLVLPALSGEQLNHFTDDQAPRKQIQALVDRDQAIITTAWRCSYYLGLLYNWNAHCIHYDQYLLNRGVNLPMSKNLILEMMYAIAYRIQELAIMLLRLVTEALYTQPCGSPRDYDPATILCALWIVYSSVKNFRKLRGDWDLAGIVKLREFLEGLDSRASAAINVIQRYKHSSSGILCHASENSSALVALIGDCLTARSIVTFAFEEFRPSGLYGLGGLDTKTKGESFTQMLSLPVTFLEDNELFYGLASRNYGHESTRLREHVERTKRCLDEINESFSGWDSSTNRTSAKSVTTRCPEESLTTISNSTIAGPCCSPSPSLAITPPVLDEGNSAKSTDEGASRAKRRRVGEYQEDGESLGGHISHDSEAINLMEDSGQMDRFESIWQRGLSLVGEVLGFVR